MRKTEIQVITMEFHLKCMSPEDVERIYPIMERDFPEMERKPLARLRELVEQGMEVGWLLVADGREAGYAFVTRHPAARFVLLDNLAMFRRGCGYGSVCLALLRQEYPQGILAEVEAEEPGLPEEENGLRRRRFGFYRRAGFVPRPFPCRVFTVPYLVHLWCPEDLEDAAGEAARALDILYAAQLPEEVYRRMICIQPPEL